MNPNAWTDAAPGTFGTSAGYYNNYRWQRQPAESLSLGRQFPLAKEGRVVLQFRAEFFNIFNRVQLTPPSVGGAFVPVNTATTGTKALDGTYTAGYGFINMVPGGANMTYLEKPRSGQLVARITF